MSGSLVSNNTTIKVSSSVTASASSAGSATIYTVAANNYLVFHATATAFATSLTLKIDSNIVWIFTAANQAATVAFYAGPSAVISLTSGAATGTITIAGALFTNNP